MAVSVTYPNGNVLTTSAMTPQDMSALWQGLTCSLLGRPALDPSFVRIAWQTQGQPQTSLPSSDVVYVSAFPQDEEYSRVRDMEVTGPPLEESWGYTRGWKIHWYFYGPSANMNAQLVWSGMFQDWLNDMLAQNDLYLVTEFRQPLRMPELINGQWWERADFEVVLYEQVTEATTVAPVSSVEVKVYGDDGSVSDITITERN